MLNEATKENLRRKSAYVDRVQLVDGKPLFSLIDISLTELCNRSAGSPKACVFCPRIDPDFYPNQALHMSMGLLRKIAGELSYLRFEGVVVLCGYGEPLLHPNIVEVVQQLKSVSPKDKFRVEVVTNGDRLSVGLIARLREAGLDFLVVSLYDGPEQVPKFRKMLTDANLVEHEHYILRDRWHTEADDFGLKLTNRAGVVGVGHQDEVDTHKNCHYPSYQMQVDWNGNIILCPQDWQKRLCFGNLNNQTMLEIWRSPALHKRRIKLIDGRREDSPCKNCNADGTLHGFNHVPIWQGK